MKAHQAYLKTRQVIKKKKLIKFEILDDKLRLVRYLDSITSKFAFVQAFCTNLNDNTYGTKYALSGNKSAGLKVSDVRCQSSFVTTKKWF